MPCFRKRPAQPASSAQVDQVLESILSLTPEEQDFLYARWQLIDNSPAARALRTLLNSLQEKASYYNDLYLKVTDERIELVKKLRRSSQSKKQLAQERRNYIASLLAGTNLEASKLTEAEWIDLRSQLQQN